MKLKSFWMALLPAIALAQQPPAEDRIRQLEARVAELEKSQQAVAAPASLQAAWADGFKLSTRDNAYSLQVGARLQYDTAYIGTDEAIEKNDGTQDDSSGFRRSIVKMQGTIHSNADFLVMFDMANDETKPLDAWVQLKNVPVLERVRAGHIKEPMGLDILASSRDLMFMERAPVLLALTPLYNMGIQAAQSHLDKHLYTAIGAFRETDPQGKSTDGDANHITARAVAIPVYEDGGKSLLHLGVSGSYQTPADDVVRYASKPGFFFAPNYIDTKSISNIDETVVYALELAAVRGPLTLMSEYVAAQPDRGDDSPTFSGWYVQAGCFLTGEFHPYSRDDARFIRQKPLRNFTNGAGPGAWEIVIRQASLDLDSGAIHGGQLDTTTAGLNWYLDPNLRVMLDYTRADEDSVGTADIVAARFQVDF